MRQGALPVPGPFSPNAGASTAAPGVPLGDAGDAAVFGAEGLGHRARGSGEGGGMLGNAPKRVGGGGGRGWGPFLRQRRCSWEYMQIFRSHGSLSARIEAKLQPASFFPSDFLPESSRESQPTKASLCAYGKQEARIADCSICPPGNHQGMDICFSMQTSGNKELSNDQELSKDLQLPKGRALSSWICFIPIALQLLRTAQSCDFPKGR